MIIFNAKKVNQLRPYIVWLDEDVLMVEKATIGVKRFIEFL